ncbi:MAG TPA: twin-arginine translocase subunit TatC [Spirochaetota bacterium]|nr:twin-arginine translocase subunit TatC [Spirochaetota bacterium]HPJ35572.1 twin-arginine translocase subunit TatC [Spirochaetota bacterium]
MAKKESDSKPAVKKTANAGKKKSAGTSTKAVKKNTSKTVAAKKKPASSETAKQSPAKKKSTAVKSTAKKKSSSHVKSGSAPVKPQTRKKKPEENLYALLTEEETGQNTLEEADPDSLARGDTPMSVVGHLDELRSRIMVILGAFFVLTMVAFYFSDFLLSIINKPFLDSGNKLNIFRIVGGFMLKLKVSAAASLFALIPLIIYQIWRFIVPAIEIKSRTFSRLTILSAIILFYSGAAFVFFIILPAAIKVMLSFIGTEMLSTIGADDYIGFLILFCLAMGVIFEIPIIILILTKLGIISPQFLITKRKYAIVIIWIMAALITPPDPLSQALVGIPLMFLYEISIVISKVISIRERKKI